MLTVLDLCLKIVSNALGNFVKTRQTHLPQHPRIPTQYDSAQFEEIGIHLFPRKYILPNFLAVSILRNFGSLNHQIHDRRQHVRETGCDRGGNMFLGGGDFAPQQSQVLIGCTGSIRAPFIGCRRNADHHQIKFFNHSLQLSRPRPDLVDVIRVHRFVYLRDAFTQLKDSLLNVFERHVLIAIIDLLLLFSLLAAIGRSFAGLSFLCGWIVRRHLSKNRRERWIARCDELIDTATKDTVELWIEGRR